MLLQFVLINCYVLCIVNCIYSVNMHDIPKQNKNERAFDVVNLCISFQLCYLFGSIINKLVLLVNLRYRAREYKEYREDLLQFEDKLINALQEMKAKKMFKLKKALWIENYENIPEMHPIVAPNCIKIQYIITSAALLGLVGPYSIQYINSMLTTWQYQPCILQALTFHTITMIIIITNEILSLALLINPVSIISYPRLILFANIMQVMAFGFLIVAVLSLINTLRGFHVDIDTTIITVCFRVCCFFRMVQILFVKNHVAPYMKYIYLIFVILFFIVLAIIELIIDRLQLEKETLSIFTMNSISNYLSIGVGFGLFEIINSNLMKAVLTDLPRKHKNSLYDLDETDHIVIKTHSSRLMFFLVGNIFIQWLSFYWNALFEILVSKEKNNMISTEFYQYFYIGMFTIINLLKKDKYLKDSRVIDVAYRTLRAICLTFIIGVNIASFLGPLFLNDYTDNSTIYEKIRDYMVPSDKKATNTGKWIYNSWVFSSYIPYIFIWVITQKLYIFTKFLNEFWLLIPIIISEGIYLAYLYATRLVYITDPAIYHKFVIKVIWNLVCIFLASTILISIKKLIHNLIGQQRRQDFQSNFYETLFLIRKKIVFKIWSHRYKKQVVNLEQGWFFPNNISITFTIILLLISIFRCGLYLCYKYIYTYDVVDIVENSNTFLLQIIYPTLALLMDSPCLKKRFNYRIAVKIFLVLNFCYQFKYSIRFLLLNSEIYYKDRFKNKPTSDFQTFLYYDWILMWTNRAEILMLLYSIIFNFRKITFQTTFLIIFGFEIVVWTIFNTHIIANFSRKETIEYIQYFYIDKISLLVGYLIIISLTKFSWHIVRTGRRYDEKLQEKLNKKGITELTIISDKVKNGNFEDTTYVDDLIIESRSPDIQKYMNSRNTQYMDNKTSIVDPNSLHHPNNISLQHPNNITIHPNNISIHSKGSIKTPSVIIQKLKNSLVNVNNQSHKESIKMFKDTPDTYNYRLLSSIEGSKFVDKIKLKVQEKIDIDQIRSDMVMAGDDYEWSD